MRRPVRSHNNVTDRKLFNNGGFPTMGAQAQMPNPANIQMGGNLPQTNNIAAPSGILASSSPLADQVAETALSQSFAPTVGMNSGGIASFDNGGFGDRVGDTLKQWVGMGFNKLGVGREKYASLNPDRERYEENRLNPYLDKPGFAEEKKFNKEYEASLPVVESTVDQTTYGGNLGIPSFTLDTRTLSTDLDGIGGPIQIGSWLDENSTVTSERIFPAEQRRFAKGSRLINPKSWEMVDRMRESDVPRSRIKAVFMRTAAPIIGVGLEIGGTNYRILENVWEVMTDIKNGQQPKWKQTLAVADMVKQQPNYSQDITDYATNIINNNPDISSQDLIEQVAVALKTKQEIPGNPIIGDLTRAADAERDAELAALEAGRANEMTLAESIEASKDPEYMKEIEEKISMKIDEDTPTKMQPKTPVEEAFERWKATGFSNEFITDVLRDEKRPPEFINAVVNMRGEKSTEGADVAVEVKGIKDMMGSPVETTTMDMETLFSQSDAAKGDGQKEVKKEVIDETDGSREGINIKGSSKEELERIRENLRKIDAKDKEGGQSKKEIETNLGEALADQVIKGDKQETTDDTYKKYFEMFKGSMGEYEGKSEYAKGMDLIALGAAIAGGQSPNAITNIANGITKTIDRFSEDDDARQKYNNQVRLSAGKFALTEMMTLAKEDRAREYTMLPYARVGKDGLIEEKQFSLNDVKNNKVPSDFKSVPVAIAEMNYMISFNKAVQDGKDAFRYKPSDWKAVKEEANEYNTAYGENHRGKFLAQEALKLVNDVDLRKDIFGVSGVAIEIKHRLARLFGGGQVVYTSRDQLLKELQQYFQALIPVKLRATQSANSISNKDVMWLADAFMIKGAQEGKLFTFAFASAPAISAKLQSAYVDFAEGEMKAIGDMQILYKGNEGMLRPNTTEATEYFKQKYYRPVTNEDGTIVTNEDGTPKLVFKGVDYSPGAQKSLADVWDMDYLKETGIYRLAPISINKE